MVGMTLPPKSAYFMVKIMWWLLEI